MTYTFTILGCGSSGGVPRVGQGWGACDPANPKNRRRRCSLLVERKHNGGQTTVLIDTSPDLREQLLDANVSALDAVLYSHDHADHTHGIDDLRPLALVQRKRIDVYADATTSELLHSRFGYCFETPLGSDYPPILQEHRIREGREVVVSGAGGEITALPFPMQHGSTQALGFRIGKVAYSCDVNGLPPESLSALQDLDLWIVDALRYRAHPSHFSVEETLGWIERVKPKRAVLTNLHTDLDFEELSGKIPVHVEPAYDGLKIVMDQ
ncbi:MAG TPA: MBL fold metallo-hydrolase [Xanthobacteraceae bacterium]|nr:MBL fold metallo-hydrolase [Xanthobacteraceae bacterium]